MNIKCCGECPNFIKNQCKLDKKLEINIVYVYESVPPKCPLKKKGDDKNGYGTMCK